MADWEIIPIMLFLTTATVVIAFTFYRYKRAQLDTEGGNEYRRLAEEAVRGQRALRDEVERMNATLKEIEKLLREVG